MSNLICCPGFSCHATNWLGVVLLPELTAGGDELPLADLEATRLDPPEDLAGEPALHRVGLDQDEAAFDSHGQRLLLLLVLVVLLRRARRVPSAGGVPGTAGSIGVSQ
jgi:hypothetical protein